jgi:hypothetical protein
MSDAREKIFDLHKTPDPNQLVAIRTREEVCDDPDLSDGAKVLFVRLLDLALNPGLNQGRKGQVIASQMKLACFLKCTERSIRRRVGELIQKLFIWTSLIPRPNTKPILCYHITAFQPKAQAHEEIPNDGLWGNGRRRFDSGFGRTGVAATGQQRRKGSGIIDRFGNPVFSYLLENAAASGHREPLRADKFVRSDRTQTSSGRGQNCPQTEDGSVLSHRSKLTAATGQNCPQTEDVSVRLKESQNRVLVLPESRRDAAPPNVASKEPGEYKPVEVPALVTHENLNWKEGLKKKFDPEIREIQDKLKQRLKKALTENERALLRWKIEATEERLFGPSHPDEVAAAAALLERPARQRPVPKPPEMTEADILGSARQIITDARKANIKPLLTDKHRIALQRVGEL